MKRKLISICILSIFLLTGCLTLGGKKKIAPVTAARPGSGERILQKERLQKGGNLLVVPFTAGVQVAATDELDRTSLMIVKGISETLAAASTSFKILNDADAIKADTLLEGHVLQQKPAAHLNPKKLKRLKKFLKVDGKMTDAKTGEVMILFSKVRETTQNSQTFEELGFLLGKDIGQFILSGAQ